MLRRRRLQFSLSALFAVLLVAACVAWWFRPAVVKVKFDLDHVTRERYHLAADLRLTNAGPDPIWVYQSQMPTSYFLVFPKREGDSDQDVTAAQAMLKVDPRSFSVIARDHLIRLKPGESGSSMCTLPPGGRGIRVAALVFDRDGQHGKYYWSEFDIPKDVVNAPPTKD